MKKLIPLLISGILVVGAFGCQESHKDADKAPQNPSVVSPLPVKPASQTTPITDKIEKAAATKNTTATTKSEGALKTEVVKKLKQSLPNNKLEVEAKADQILIKGTATSQAELQKAEKLAKEVEGVTSVKTEAKVQPPNKI
ncbi:BON domain-containing protein [Nostoc sp. FACHB-152]|uniref:BON domain-containing protein n=1 Tax=unclassified Nostoc TaxID=2593658 RepID=UPI001688B465|nr:MULTISPECIES: BON domain-containing protein [unclassified Nostoc]MBD2445730.1 BON domain-containing protein [Nostoc sp. FACHB-152]MBD2466844.1 BON domain-containing protein [Nostoc sp. FACHB-145]